MATPVKSLIPYSEELDKHYAPIGLKTQEEQVSPFISLTLV